MRSVSRNDPPCAWECLTWCWPPHHWWVHTTSWCPPLVGGCPPLVGAYHWLVGGQMWIKMDGPCRSTIDLSAGTLAGWLSASSDPDNVFDIRLALYSYYWPATHAHTYINISLCIFDEFIYISTFCWRNPKRSQLRVVSIVCKMATPPSRPERPLGFSFTTVNNPRKIDIAILTFYSGKCINGGLASDLPIWPTRVGKWMPL